MSTPWSEDEEIDLDLLQDDDRDLDDSFLRAVARPDDQVLKLPPIVAGDRLGGLEGARFLVRKHLGGGAMGEVYLAHDALLDRPVALKLLRARIDEDGVPLSEARTLARLDHPGIVRIHDIDQHRCHPFLVMEFVEGQRLDRAAREENMQPVRVVELIASVADALEHAHQRQVVHRDLKPSNLILTRDRMKVIDFGLAQPGGLRAPSSGTPPYMSPEQWRGEEQDGRTDIWALGVVLFELLAGVRPYPDETLEEQVRSHREVPRLLERAPHLRGEAWAPAAESLLARALAKPVEERIATCAELRDELIDLGARIRMR